MAKQNIPPFIPTGASLTDSYLYLAFYEIYKMYFTNLVSRDQATKLKQEVIATYNQLTNDTDRLIAEYKTDPSLFTADAVIEYLYKEVTKK